MTSGSFFERSMQTKLQCLSCKFGANSVCICVSVDCRCNVASDASNSFCSTNRMVLAGGSDECWSYQMLDLLAIATAKSCRYVRYIDM